MHVLIELEERSSIDRNTDTGREHSSSGGKYHISPKSSRSDQNIINNNERMPSVIHKEPIRLQDSSESSDRNTDYDSSIEDLNERYDRYLASNRKN
jgi:hypothetical protein